MPASSQTEIHILNTAIRVFAETGLHASLRAIARTADVSPALVVHYFANKQKLLTASTDLAFRRLSQNKTETGFPRNFDVGEFVETMSPELRLIRRHLVAGGDIASDLFDDGIRVSEQTLVSLQESGELPMDADVSGAAALLTAQAFGSIVFHELLTDRLSKDSSTTDVAARLIAAQQMLLVPGLAKERR